MMEPESIMCFLFLEAGDWPMKENTDITNRQQLILPTPMIVAHMFPGPA